VQEKVSEVAKRSIRTFFTNPSSWGRQNQGIVSREAIRHHPQKDSRVLQVFLNADLRCAHAGLSKLAQRSNLDVRKLENGQYILFLNAAKDRLKMFAANNVVAYFKAPQGTRIDLRVLSELPRVFNGTSIDYDAALRKTLTQALERKRA
jgi:hypothetical protein